MGRKESRDLRRRLHGWCPGEAAALRAANGDLWSDISARSLRAVPRTDDSDHRRPKRRSGDRSSTSWKGLLRWVIVPSATGRSKSARSAMAGAASVTSAIGRIAATARPPGRCATSTAAIGSNVARRTCGDASRDDSAARNSPSAKSYQTRMRRNGQFGAGFAHPKADTDRPVWTVEAKCQSNVL